MQAVWFQNPTLDVNMYLIHQVLLLEFLKQSHRGKGTQKLQRIVQGSETPLEPAVWTAKVWDFTGEFCKDLQITASDPSEFYPFI